MNPEQESTTQDVSSRDGSSTKVPVSFQESDSQMPANPAVSKPEVVGQAAGSLQQPTDDQQIPVMPTAAVGSPVVSTHIVSGSNTAGPVTAVVGHHGPRLRGKKRLLAAALSIVLLVGLGTGYVFAFYIPNKPENVWKSAITNTGKAYDMLTEYATKNKAAKSYKISGAYNLSGPFASNGSVTGEVAGQNSQLSGDFAASGLKVGFDVRTLKTTGQTPDLYFKLTGLESLGGMLGAASPQLAAIVGDVNGQWFSVDHSIFDKAGVKSSDLKFTKADAERLLKLVGDVSKEYLFTVDPQKAVIVVKDTVGAEKKDGRNTYHYKVGYDSTHFGLYVEALCKRLTGDKLVEALMNDTKSVDCQKIASQARANKSTDKTDVWVDKRTKLIHVLRLTDGKNASNYAEISQDYQGGDDLPFGFKFHADGLGSRTDLTLSNTLNMKTNVFSTKGSFSYGGNEAADGKSEKGTFSMSVTPSSDSAIKVQKPEHAKSFMELLNQLGLGSAFSQTVTGYDGIQDKARDTKRKTDIVTLQAHMEAYFTNKVTYPTLNQLNNSAWVKKNLLGLSSEALKDPEGTSAVLAAKPAAHVYAYQGANCTSTGCRHFTLSATLSDGSIYSKSDLN